MTEMIVFPESGPTRSFQLSQSAMSSLASAHVVRIPSARTPMPVASVAAAAGPVGLSGTVAAAGAWDVVPSTVISSPPLR